MTSIGDLFSILSFLVAFVELVHNIRKSSKSNKKTAIQHL